MKQYKVSIPSLPDKKKKISPDHLQIEWYVMKQNESSNF